MLTKSEEEIMYLLWDLDEPLTPINLSAELAASQKEGSANA